MDPTKTHIGNLQRTITAVRPKIEAVEALQSFRPGYRMFPARVTLRTRDGDVVEEVLKTADTRETLEFEKAVLEALGEIGLPVPQVRSPLFEVGLGEGAGWGMLLQKMEGTSLDWLGLDNLCTADASCRLTLAGVEGLHRLTGLVAGHRISALLPRRTLEDEFRSLSTGTGPWLSEGFYRRALRALEGRITAMAVPLVFSNGDYNPLNFLAKDGALVGWIDFEHACFEDPHIGFAKFLLWAEDSYGWAAGSRAGLVERWVFNQNLPPSDFYGRVVLRGLSQISLRSVADRPAAMIEVVKLFTERLSPSSPGPAPR